ncbi:hypothetical protein IJJ08_04570 [bacterium]|nr:hypothetical protein [bacterium]
MLGKKIKNNKLHKKWVKFVLVGIIALFVLAVIGGGICFNNQLCRLYSSFVLSMVTSRYPKLKIYMLTHYSDDQQNESFAHDNYRSGYATPQPIVPMSTNRLWQYANALDMKEYSLCRLNRMQVVDEDRPGQWRQGYSYGEQKTCNHDMMIVISNAGMDGGECVNGELTGDEFYITYAVRMDNRYRVYTPSCTVKSKDEICHEYEYEDVLFGDLNVISSGCSLFNEFVIDGPFSAIDDHHLQAKWVLDGMYTFEFNDERQPVYAKLVTIDNDTTHVQSDFYINQASLSLMIPEEVVRAATPKNGN